MKLTRRTELLIGLILILGLIGFIGFQFLSNGLDKDMILTKMDQAVMDGDVDYLKSRFEMSDGAKLDDQAVKELILHMKAGGILPSNIELKADAEPDPSFDGRSVRPVYLLQDGKDKLIFNNYKLVFEYFDLVVDSNLIYGDFEVYIDGEKVEDPVFNDYELVCQMIKPGNHNLEIKYDEDFKRSYSEEFKAVAFNRLDMDGFIDSDELKSKLKDFNSRIPLYIEAYENFTSINVYSSLPGDFGKVYLVEDGKKTDKILNTAEGVVVGPIFDGDLIKVKGQVEIDGETYESQEFSLDINSYGNYDLAIDYQAPYELTEQDMSYLMDSYLRGLVSSINSGYFSHVSEYIDPDGPLYKMQKDLIDYTTAEGISESLIGYDWRDFKKIDKNIYQVVFFEEHERFQPDKEAKLLGHTWLYTIVLKNDRPYVHKLEKYED